MAGLHLQTLRAHGGARLTAPQWGFTGEQHVWLTGHMLSKEPRTPRRTFTNPDGRAAYHTLLSCQKTSRRT